LEIYGTKIFWNEASGDIDDLDFTEQIRYMQKLKIALIIYGKDSARNKKVGGFSGGRNPLIKWFGTMSEP